MAAASLATLLLVGGLLTVQAAANIQLSAALRSPAGASMLQLGVAAALLLAVAGLALSLGALDRLDDLPAWHLAGGLGSSLYITAGIVLVPRLGAIATVGLVVAGQMLASLVLDGFGLLGLEATSLGWSGTAAAVAVVAAAAAIVRDAALEAPHATRSRLRTIALVALALAAGAVLPMQGAINAQLRSDLDAPLAAAALSFVVATTAMAPVVLATALLGRVPRPEPGSLRRVPWCGSEDSSARRM